MRVNGKGFLLVSVLLITVILLTLGLSFLGKRAIQYRRAVFAEQAAQAKALSESGLDDAIAKLQWDLEFPPLSLDQTAFTYTEEVKNSFGRVGSYQVTLDGTYRFPPYSVWIVTVRGEFGPDPVAPLAVRTLRAEFDVSKKLRDAKKKKNPYYHEVINFQDLGAL